MFPKDLFISIAERNKSAVDIATAFGLFSAIKKEGVRWQDVWPDLALFVEQCGIEDFDLIAQVSAFVKQTIVGNLYVSNIGDKKYGAVSFYHKATNGNPQCDYLYNGKTLSIAAEYMIGGVFDYVSKNV